MKKSINHIIILNIISVIILVLIGFFATSLFQNKNSAECFDASSATTLKYSLCYDENLNSVIMSATRDLDSYKITKIEVSFTDTIAKNFRIDSPLSNEVKRYNFTAVKNPGKARVFIELETSLTQCQEPKTILIKSCGEDINLSTNLGSTNKTLNSPGKKSDFLSPKLIKSQNLSSICSSNWACGNWESCDENIQRRICIDTSHCLVQTNIPDSARNCNETCKEDWSCEWSTCENGITTPSCFDANSCGTEYSKPNKLSCTKAPEGCNPDIYCEEWSQCNINLGILKLAQNLPEIQGTKSRLCRDKNACTSPIYEFQTCAIRVDIYTKEVDWYGEKYLEVYDRLTDKLLSRVRYSGSNLDLNFYLE